MARTKTGGGPGTNQYQVKGTAKQPATTATVNDGTCAGSAAASDDPFATSEATVSNYTPDDLNDYYASLHNRHWNPDAGAGSQFTGTTDLHDLLSQAADQRGNLDGDDRDQLIARGADPDAFSDQARYLLVSTPGLEGTIAADQLDDDTPVVAERTKPGVPCSLIVRGQQLDRPETNVATVIIGPKPNDASTEVVWTAHPGLPTTPAKDDRYDDGQQLTAASVRADLGNPKLLIQN